jgi:hypothetical protein
VREAPSPLGHGSASPSRAGWIRTSVHPRIRRAPRRSGHGPASPGGFEPPISTVTGWRPLRAGPRGLLAVVSGQWSVASEDKSLQGPAFTDHWPLTTARVAGGSRTHTAPGHGRVPHPLWVRPQYPRQESNLHNLRLRRAACLRHTPGMSVPRPGVEPGLRPSEGRVMSVSPPRCRAAGDGFEPPSSGFRARRSSR